METQRAKLLFDAYPKEAAIHETSDGQVFFKKNDADNHARHLPDTFVSTIYRTTNLTETESQLKDHQDLVADHDLKVLAGIKEGLDEKLDTMAKGKDLLVSQQVVAGKKQKEAVAALKDFDEANPPVTPADSAEKAIEGIGPTAATEPVVVAGPGVTKPISAVVPADSVAKITTA